jgi:hypothetical protein
VISKTWKKCLNKTWPHRQLRRRDAKIVIFDHCNFWSTTCCTGSHATNICWGIYSLIRGVLAFSVVSHLGWWHYRHVLKNRENGEPRRRWYRGKMLGNLPIPGPGTVFKEHVGWNPHEHTLWYTNNHKHSYWKWSFIVELPNENGDLP